MLSVLDHTRATRQRGFNLVELMVALVIGLIVSGVVLALVIAIIRSNRQTLQTTRLNSELRATLAVIANDLRRARAVDDPLSTVVVPGGNPYRAVSTAIAGCVVYAYEDAIDGPWHVIKLDSGRVVLQGAATKPANCSPAGTPEVLGSDQVEITALTFTPTTTSATPPEATDEGLVRAITVTIAGRLIDNDQSLSTITRTMAQTVYVRSVGTGS
ncbi:MAG TPA: prepilin-type N-terminal cleavage/methylation domain-containing protein [Lysobacter sp.]